MTSQDFQECVRIHVLPSVILHHEREFSLMQKIPASMMQTSSQVVLSRQKGKTVNVYRTDADDTWALYM